MADYLTRARQDRKNQDDYIREETRAEERAIADQRVAAERAAREIERAAADQRLAAERAAVVERNARAIRAMRVSGYADSDIAHLLDIPETEVSAVQK